MSPNLWPDGQPRPAAVVNEDIRALVQGAGRRLNDEEKAALERLWVEWVAADQAEIVEAA